MREGWEIKKLGEVCELFTDGDWIESKDQSNKGIRLIQTGNIGCGEFNDKADHYRYISEETFIRLNCTEIYAGDILISRLPDPIGRSCIIPRMPHRMITAVDCTIVRPENIINPNFLVYYTNSRPYQDEINRYVTGAVRKRISRKNLFKIPIPVPPLSEQERIVAELDLLSDVIAKKREQLKQLDALAQSIFYDMFGDPITNEKGWETKKFEDCYRLTSGQGLSAKSILSGEYPVYGGNGIIGYHCIYNLDGENIIIGRVGALCGNVRYVIGKVFITDNAFILTKKIKNVNIFLLYLLRLHNLRKYAREAMQPVISNSGLKNILIIIPPLALQQQFASMIESIEKQKELIKQSLSEVQQLFDSRMDYYFG